MPWIRTATGCPAKNCVNHINNFKQIGRHFYRILIVNFDGFFIIPERIVFHSISTERLKLERHAGIAFNPKHRLLVKPQFVFPGDAAHSILALVIISMNQTEYE